MGDPRKEHGTTRSHEEIISDKPQRLEALRLKIESNPTAQWQEYHPAPELSVIIPASALIETDAMIEDLQSNPSLFQVDSKAIRDHGPLFRNPRTFSFVMQAALGCEDWDGLMARIALQTGMTTCGEMMEKMEDPLAPEYRRIYEIFDHLDLALRYVEELAPLK